MLGVKVSKSAQRIFIFCIMLRVIIKLLFLDSSRLVMEKDFLISWGNHLIPNTSSDIFVKQISPYLNNIFTLDL